MTIQAFFEITSDLPECKSLILSSDHAQNSWFWTVKLMPEGEVSEAWSSESEFDSSDAAIADCLAFLTSMAFGPKMVSVLM